MTQTEIPPTPPTRLSASASATPAEHQEFLRDQLNPLVDKVNSPEVRDRVTDPMTSLADRRQVHPHFEFNGTHLIGHSIVKTSYRMQKSRHRLVLRLLNNEVKVIKYKKGLSWRKAKKLIKRDLVLHTSPDLRVCGCGLPHHQSPHPPTDSLRERSVCHSAGYYVTWVI